MAFDAVGQARGTTDRVSGSRADSMEVKAAIAPEVSYLAMIRVNRRERTGLRGAGPAYPENA
jgi:hypothetical protein